MQMHPGIRAWKEQAKWGRREWVIIIKIETSLPFTKGGKIAAILTKFANAGFLSLFGTTQLSQ